MPWLRIGFFMAASLFLAVPARAEAGVEAAFTAAIAAFEQARPALGSEFAGVDIAAYRDALTLRRFSSAHWGGATRLEIILAESDEGACARYAAYVRIPPRDGVVPLVFCPEFRRKGTAQLRALTILHEMVHVLAGPDECRAMAFAARVEHIANGRHTDVSRYWQANGCATSGFRLP